MRPVAALNQAINARVEGIFARLGLRQGFRNSLLGQRLTILIFARLFLLQEGIRIKNRKSSAAAVANALRGPAPGPPVRTAVAQPSGGPADGFVRS